MLELVEKLKGIVGSENVITDDAGRKEYAFDPNAFPEAVVRPGSADEVSAVVKAAAESRTPVLPVGGRTSIFRGVLPQVGGIYLSLERMNRVIEYEPENHTIKVEAGMLNGKLQETLAKDRLFYPVDNIGAERSTIGGGIAANASGPRKLKYGVAKDYILGLQVVLGNGDVIEPGGKCVKNAAGYDISRFMNNSWGALGIITQATLRLKPVPEKEVIILAWFGDDAGALKAADELAAAKVQLAALDYLNSRAVECLKAAGYSTADRSLLYMVLDGFREPVDWTVEKIKESLAGATVEVREDAEGRKEALNLRSAAFEAAARSGLTLQGNASVLLTRADEFIAKAGGVAGPDMAVVSHLWNGHAHILLRADVETEVLKGLARAASEEKGLFLVDNDPDLSRHVEWSRRRGEGVERVVRMVKEAFDPSWILAPTSKVLAVAGSRTAAD